MGSLSETSIMVDDGTGLNECQVDGPEPRSMARRQYLLTMVLGPALSRCRNSMCRVPCAVCRVLYRDRQGLGSLESAVLGM